MNKFITVGISNLINARYSADKHQGKTQEEPVYDGDIDLAHKFPRSMNNFKTRETTKCS